MKGGWRGWKDPEAPVYLPVPGSPRLEVLTRSRMTAVTPWARVKLEGWSTHDHPIDRLGQGRPRNRIRRAGAHRGPGGGAGEAGPRGHLLQHRQPPVPGPEAPHV